LSVGPRMREAKPREVITLPFRVSNTGSQTREFVGKVNLPAGWLSITREFPFKLDAGKSEVRLISFFLPQTAPAGTYEVTYLVNDRKIPSIRDGDSVIVVVLPLVKLKVELLEAPEYIVAGENYQSHFIVINEGNVTVTVDLEIKSRNDYPATTEVMKFQLIPGELRSVAVNVKTDAKIHREIRHHLELTARILEPKYIDITSSAFSWVKIIPRATNIEDPFHKIPVKIKLREVMGENEENKQGFQSEISGRGTLDEEGTKHIDFLFRGPDTQEKSVFGQHDEYYLSYWTDKYKLHLGDHIFSLSPLTERHRYGCGIEGKLNIGMLTTGAYHQRSRWTAPAQEQTAAYLRYHIGQVQKLGLNYLKKEEDNSLDIWSLQALLEPMEDTYLELEYARGEKEGKQGSKFSDAYRIRNYGRYDEDEIYYWLEKTYAQPEYLGYYRDLDFNSAGMAFPISDNLRVVAYGFQRRKNLALDPSRPALSEKCSRFGLNYRPTPGTTLSCEYRKAYHKDRFSSPSFDYREESLRTSVGRSFEKLSFRSSIEIGKTRDNLTGQLTDLRRYGASVICWPISGQRYSGYFQIGDFYNSTGEYQRRTIIGLNGYLKISERTSLNAGLQTNEQESSYIQDIIEISLEHQLSNDHKLALRIRHISYKNSSYNKEIAALLEYVFPLEISVSRKRSVGMIKGQVCDVEDNGRGIANVFLRANGIAAVTDKNGNFTFPSLKPGKYYLRVDRASIGLDRVTVQNNPTEVVVKGGEEITVSLGVVRSASLIGKIMVYRLLNNNNVTDEKGYFRFKEVRPGKWILKVHSDNLPRYHYLEENTFSFELKPGDKKEMLIRVLPKKRPIHIIEKGEISLGEE